MDGASDLLVKKKCLVVENHLCENLGQSKCHKNDSFFFEIIVLEPVNMGGWWENFPFR